ncbi:glyoxylase-like metal-dependent hydrolase (beta-lactamase superfamily II), partial [Stenotrophomonas sp. 2619]|uniref:MBL fold metallo-hydrolase n=1 Tax=Stenotrophomonas sp. 2619 TaxID=3156316 RepID=UPI00339331F1
MQLKPLGPDVFLCLGEDYHSVATVFVDGNHVLLVDSLGSAADAAALRVLICDELGKTVRVIVSTHFMSDHVAGLSTFPDALAIAHRNYRHTFLSQNRRVDAF